MKNGNALLGVIVLILVVGAIIYFVSDPFKTKVDEATRQVTQWTPENIQKDPAGYLAWSRKQCESSIASLEANLLALKTRKAADERSKVGEEADLKAYSALLSEAKSLYVTSSSSGNHRFPVVFRGLELTEDELKTKIIEANRKITKLNDAISIRARSINSLTAQINKTQQALEAAQQLLDKVSRDINIVKSEVSDSGFKKD